MFVVLFLFIGEDIIDTADIVVVGSTRAGPGIVPVFNIITNIQGKVLEDTL